VLLLPPHSASSREALLASHMLMWTFGPKFLPQRGKNPTATPKVNTLYALVPHKALLPFPHIKSSGSYSSGLGYCDGCGA